MTDYHSFDLVFLGLRDPSSVGRARFTSALNRLRSTAPERVDAILNSREPLLFEALDGDRATTAVEILGEAGALLEVRRNESQPSEASEQMDAVVRCPSCNLLQPAGAEECERCGVVFAKFDREQVSRMKADQQLEEAVQRTQQIRAEWLERARTFVDRHPMSSHHLQLFASDLMQDELPFLALAADEGEMLLTSRRLLVRDGDRTASIPYEMIADVDIGGGLVQKKNRERLALTLHGPIMLSSGPGKSLTRQLDKDCAVHRDVIMDWAFARSFICNACGERDLDYRLEGTAPHARCMHCATDHVVDLREGDLRALAPR